jgi:hypothetical protein
MLESTVDIQKAPSRPRTLQVATPETVVNSSHQSDRIDALVTHGWGRTAYSIVRSLGKRGLKVAVGTDEFLGMALLSRYTAVANERVLKSSPPRRCGVTDSWDGTIRKPSEAG